MFAWEKEEAKRKKLYAVAQRVRRRVPTAIVKSEGETNLVHVTLPKNSDESVGLKTISDEYVTRFDGMDKKYVYLCIDLDLPL